MKTNEWSYRKHDIVTWTIACIMWTLVLLGIMLSSCTTPKTYYDLSATQQSWFDTCIEYHPSDAVCDSCFTMIYGYSIEE